MATRLPLRPLASAGALTLAAGLITTGLISANSASADPLASARARAAALSREVNRLTTQAEVASQAYDATEAKLGVVVTSSLEADRRVASARATAARAQQEIDQRVGALYAAAGNLGLVPSVVSGNAEQVVQSGQLSAALLSSNTQAVARDRVRTQISAQQAGVHRISVQRQMTLETKAAAETARVNRLLARQRTALATADATVRRLVVEQQRAQQAASAAAFAAAVGTPTGHLPPSTTAPNSVAAAAIAAARTRLGDPYVWGATGPGSFDCSGLTQWSYAHAGIALPRTAAEQWYSGPHPALTQLEPGDLLFWATDVNNPATIHHVTIYVGAGMMIAAPHTGVDVQVQPVYFDGLIGATRPWAGH